MAHARQLKVALRSVGLASLLLVLVACGGAVNQENYDKITVGQTTKVQVEQLLGSGTEETPSEGFAVTGAGVATSSKSSDDRIFTWKDGNGGTITITFDKGVVVEKHKSGF
jgi:hypothetical protein